jgi:acyl-homoserine lactone acylase PvdQ
MSILALLLALSQAQPAFSAVQPYGTNDGGGFRNILPPGSGGFDSPFDVAQFELTCPPNGPQNCPNARRPPHSSDELQMYGNLVYASPRLRTRDIGKYYKDATFGVKSGEAERVYSPRGDVTIVRDRRFGVPRIYGTTRAGAMFGLGYAGAEDRLFVMDVLRHAGRAELSSFAGGSPGNREMDREQWRLAPYREADFETQYNRAPQLYGSLGRQVQDDVRNYVAGINKYISEARNPLTGKMPAEYAAIGRSQGPDNWKVTDVIATASLIGGIFGKGGGRELDSASILRGAQARFGRRRGRRVWKDLREADDREAPVTVARRRFPYRAEPRHLRRGSLAIPDFRSFRRERDVVASSGSGSGGGGGGGGGILPPLPALPGGLPGLLGFPSRDQGSNALLVSARESKSGRPLAVMGPQTGYFSPNLLMDVEVHGPGLDARGATFAGIGLYVLLGHGRDYAWSATSAGQDNIDTFAMRLCNPNGSRPSLSSSHYLYRGQCLPFDVLDRSNSWSPTLADSTPAGSQTLRAERTKLGLVVGRGRVHGRPVVYTSLRSPYFHEADSAGGFVALNDPGQIRGPHDFQRAVSRIGFTFNWFYVDHSNIAYFNSGNNPIRARRVSANFPVSGRFPWRHWNPDLWTASYTPFRRHPRVINQRFITNWNNKQARGYRAADDNFAYGSVYRSDSLADRIRRGIRGRRKMSLAQLIDAMEGAGTVDLRGSKVLPYALRAIGRPRDPRLRHARAVLRAWYLSGAHRLDRNHNGVYDNAEAVRIMDAWWPKLVHAEFRPTLGPTLFRRLESMLDPDDEPNAEGTHVGSAYNGGWYAYANKDLRRVLGRRRLHGLRRPPRRRARYSRIYCGGRVHRNGNLRRCRSRLRASLLAALRVPASRIYGHDQVCHDYGFDSRQWCFDAIYQRPVGAIKQPLIEWINRPTFQQAIEIGRSVGR